MDKLFVHFLPNGWFRQYISRLSIFSGDNMEVDEIGVEAETDMIIDDNAQSPILILGEKLR